MHLGDDRERTVSEKTRELIVGRADSHNLSQHTHHGFWGLSVARMCVCVQVHEL